MIYFKQIFRTIIKNKTASFFSVFSLIVSFLGIIFLVLYVSFEKSYDDFHDDSELLYRMETDVWKSWLPAVMVEDIRGEIPEIEYITPYRYDPVKLTTPEMEKSNSLNIKSSVAFTESSFFSIFSFQLKRGDPKNVLDEPYSAVLTEKIANKFFKRKNPIGERIIANGVIYNVTGVIEDFPENSSIKPECLLSFSTARLENKFNYFNSYSEWSFNIYMKLIPGVNSNSVAAKIRDVNRIDKAFKEVSNKKVNIVLQSVSNIHFLEKAFVDRTINPIILKVLILLVIILTVMGAVNYMNFSTSQAPLRAKSLAVARVMGGKKILSKVQIIMESVFLSIIAMGLSLIIYWVTYTQVESIFDINGLALIGRGEFVLKFILFSIAFGILAGLYPSYYVTSASIAQVVKGDVGNKGNGNLFRNILITIQFIFTIGLIISATVVEEQLNYWRNFDSGINKENVVFLETTPQLIKHSESFANDLLKNNNIIDYTYSHSSPGNVEMTWIREMDGENIKFDCWGIDKRFLDFFDIKMEQGRAFNSKSDADVNNFIVNQKFVEEYGIEKPLEKKLTGFDFEGQIVGVAKNFNYSSLKEDITPMVFWLTKGRKKNLFLKINPVRYSKTIAYIKNIAEKYDEKNTVEVRFVDDWLNKLYMNEEKMGRFIEFVAMWCVLLSVTGLLGLTIFICRARTKEIGIRKVNGAKVNEILLLLNGNLVKWVVLAFFIAAPIAYLVMNNWLRNFVFRINISWWIFILAGIVVLTIALITVTWQGCKAAVKNPIDALKYE